MIAIGMRYGNSEPGGFGKDAAMVEVVKQFQDEFIARNGTTLCRELIGYDFSQPGEREKAKREGAIFEVCPKLVLDALEILEQIM